MATALFELILQDVDEAVKAPAVQAYLRGPKQRFAPVVWLFFVTGMKLIKGVKMEYLTLGTTAFTGNISIDISTLGITFGLKDYGTRMNNAKTKFN